MSEQARELAELMGWEVKSSDGPHYSYFLLDSNNNFKVGTWEEDLCWKEVPAYDTDLNAMREVWAVLWKQGLWDKFYRTWDVEIDNCHTLKASSVFYRFLNDLPGQVTAAIKVWNESAREGASYD